LGLKYLDAAGYSGKGLLTTLKKIRGKQWFESSQIPTYMMTHPAVEERIARLDTLMAMQPPDKGAVSANAGREAEFKKINTRLKALYQPVEVALPQFKNAVEQNPDDSMNAYGYGLVLDRLGRRDQAIEYIKKALSGHAFDGDILSDLGRAYFRDGQYEKALGTLEAAASLSKKNADGLFYLGRTRMELDQLPAAVEAFERVLSLYPGYSAAYQFAGEVYGRMGNMPEAHYFLGVYSYRKGEYRTARYHLSRAQQSIKDPEKLKITKEALETINKMPKEGQG
jgi:predicted Zn-dependent protease